jgi:leader peptidase (prepilin peptidase) / N-methyltransferase
MNGADATRFRPHRATLFFIAAYAILAMPVLREGAMSWKLLAISVGLGATLARLSTIDLRTFRLPDVITLPLMAAGPVLAWALGWEGGAAWRIAAAAAGFLSLYAVAHIYERVRGRAGLGLGDAKLFAAAGAWLGLDGLPTVMLWATGTALAAVIVATLAGHQVGRSTHVPFGPFLALGFWLVWLYGTIA